MAKKFIYKDHETIMDYDPENEIFFGKIEKQKHDINIAFYADTPEKFKKEFRKAVDDLIEYKKWTCQKISEFTALKLLKLKDSNNG